MPSNEWSRVYESGDLRRITGDAIRPGAFALTDRAMAFCSFPPGARVLDVGCGTGATVQHLLENHHLNAVGVDPSPVLLACGRQRRPGLPLFEAPGENLPFAGGEMDGILAECTLSVMENADRALAECCRVLKSGGRLVVADVYARNPEGVGDLRRLPPISCLTGAMTRQALTEKITANGFTVVLWEDHSRLLADLAARLIMANGPLEDFWSQSAGGAVSGRAIQEAIKKSRPGYFLLIAAKSG
jgi:SAM-dependent methyltransferase